MTIEELISDINSLIGNLSSDVENYTGIHNLLENTLQDLTAFRRCCDEENYCVDKKVRKLVESRNPNLSSPLTYTWAKHLFNAVSAMTDKNSQKPKRSRRYISIIIITGILLSALLGLSIASFFLLPKNERNLYSLFTMLVGIADFICGISFFIYECISDKNKPLATNGDNAPSERTYSKSQRKCAYICAVGAFVLSMFALVIMLILAFKPFQIPYEKAQSMWAWSCISSILSLIVVAFGVFQLKRGTLVQVFVLVTVVVCIGSIVFQHLFKPVAARNDIVEYIANEDGSAYQAVIIPQDVETDYVIAANYDGKPITSIGRKDPEKPLYIKSLDIGANITTIGDESFAHSRGLRHITLPQNVTEIGARAFYDCVDLVDVTVNCNLTKVGNEVFDKCNALSTVWWNSNGNSVGFGDIFVSCESIRTVILGHSINSIATNMFNNCKSIEEVVLYENIKSIGTGAFANCDSLQSVFYRGNADQWQNITVGRDCQSLMSAQIYYYSQQEPQLSDDGLSYNGNYWHSDDSGLPVVWKYTPPTYTVKFYADGKLCKEVTYIKNDTHIEEPAVPAKKGYTGIWENYTLNNNDIVVNAVYTAKTYTLNLDYNGADGENSKKSITATYDQPVVGLPTPTKTGYAFDGWYIGEQKISSSTKWQNDAEESYTLIAHYKTIYVVRFYVGGKHYKDIKYLEGQSTIEEPAVPVKKGYTGAWEKYTLNNSNITVNAVYTAKTYKLIFDYNGATDSVGLDSKIVTYGEIVGDLPQPTAGLANIFVGWYIGDVCIKSSTVWTYDEQDVYTVQAHYECLDFYGGSGTEQNPFLIESVDDFLNIKLYPTVYYELIADIDMTGIDYTVINSFSGNFDGKGHWINNLSLYSNAVETNKIGIFGVNNGTVRNLNLRNCSFTLSPPHHNNTVTNYCGTIAGVNNGTIENCHILESKVISNSSDVADKFMAQFNEDPREIVRGSANWAKWITQEFAAHISSWPAVPMGVFAGGIVGQNSGNVIKCSFGGKVEANMYNMHCYCNDNKAGTSGKGQANCFAGGLAGQNEGTISQSEANAQVRAWIELNNNGNGNGWVGDMYVWGVCYACGLVGSNVNGTVDGTSNCTQQADYRIFAPQSVFGPQYNWSTKGHADNLTIGTSDTYK